MKKFFYRVTEGDSIVKLSVSFNIPPMRIIELNGLLEEIESGDLLYLEQEEREIYIVKVGDSLEELANEWKKSPSQILEENNLPYLFVGARIYK